MVLIQVVYRGTSLSLEASTVAELSARFQEAVPMVSPPRFLLRGALLPDGPLPPPATAAGSLRIMAITTTLDEAAAIKSARPARLRDDLNLAEHRVSSTSTRHPQRALRRPDSFGFGSIDVLPEFADAEDARVILERLAKDPGVLAVMSARRWRVPILGEMYPEGRVGTDPVCVLGFNVNRGQRINLRVRTDDLAGFRKYEVIKNVLWHELAHNEISEHTGEFYALVSTLKHEGNAADWTRASGTTLSSSQTVFRPPERVQRAPPDGRVLGGEGISGATEAIRNARVQAAVARVAAAPARAQQPSLITPATEGMQIRVDGTHECIGERVPQVCSTTAHSHGTALQDDVHGTAVNIGPTGKPLASAEPPSATIMNHLIEADNVDKKRPDGDVEAHDTPAVESIDNSQDDSMLAVESCTANAGSATVVSIPTAYEHELDTTPDDPTADRRRRLLTALDHLVADCLVAGVSPSVAVKTLAGILSRAFDAVLGHGIDKHRSIRPKNHTLQSLTASSVAVREFLLGSGFTLETQVGSEAESICVPEGARADVASLWLGRELADKAAQDLNPA